MKLKMFISSLVIFSCIQFSQMFKIFVDKIDSTDQGKQDMESVINSVNNLNRADIHDQYMASVKYIIEMGGVLVSKIVQRKSGLSGITLNTQTLDACSNWDTFTNMAGNTYVEDLVIYYLIDPYLYDYFTYFPSQPGTGQEYMHGITCTLSQDLGYDLKRPQAGLMIFNYANQLGSSFIDNGQIWNFDSYVKLAAKAILNIMGLNIDLSQYWLDSSGNVYSSNPIKLFKTTSDGKDHYAIYSPSILSYANTYFKPTLTPTYLILGTYTHVNHKYVTMSMHLAPEDLTSEVNQLPFYYVISGFTLALINDMGWYQVDSSLKQPLSFASSVPASFLSDVQSQSANLSTLYTSLFATESPSADQCYLAYGKKEVINSRSPQYIATGVLLYKQMCQRSDGFTKLNYYSYTPTSGCFISTFPNSSTSYVCLEQQCQSSGAMISVTVGEVTTSCNNPNSTINGIKAFSTSSAVYSLTCPSDFNLYCTSEKPCLNNCTQNGICIHNFCQCKENYIGLYCQKLCGANQWYDAQAGTCVDTCPTGYYGNVSLNRQCTQCATANCLDDCVVGYYRKTGETNCTQCPYQCSQCTSDTYCSKCKFGFILTNNFCYCEVGYFDSVSNTCISCSSNQYYDSAQNKCLACDSTCLTCQDSSTKCTSCIAPKVFYNFTCIDTCPIGTFANVNRICQNCDSNCSECSGQSTYCTKCYNNLTLSSENKCVCVNSYYDITTNKCIFCASNELLDLVNSKCIPCNSNCAKCENTITNCTACYNNLQVSLSGQCICINAIYDSVSNSCIPCNSNQLLDQANNKCLDCNSNCAACSTTVTKCTQCYNNLTLQSDKCVCVNSIYDSVTNSCIACKSNEYVDSVNNKCVACSTNCQKCEISSTKCTACYNNLTLQSGVCMCVNAIYDSASNSCIPCAANQLLDSVNNKCLDCDQNCSTCSTSITTCTACYNNLTLQSGKCVCINQIYDSTTKTCKSCLTNEITDTINNKCIPCDLNCSQCQNIPTYCTACYNNLTLQNNACICVNSIYDSVSNSCKTCNSNQLMDLTNNKCLDCDSNCSSCQTTITNCTACYNNLTLQNGKCVCINQIYDSVTKSCKSCNANEYIDTINNKCVLCDSNCATCQNSSINCTSCKNNLTLQTGKCVCINAIYDSASNSCIPCASNQLLDSANNKCLTCDTKCSTCQNTVTNCTACINNLTLQNGTCLCLNAIYDSATQSCKTCSPNQLLDLANNQCLDCNTNCATCQSTVTNCTSCFNNLTLQSGKCVCINQIYDSVSKSCITCNSNQITDLANNQCLNCDSTCSTCQTTVTNCTACINNLSLLNGKCVCIDSIYDSISKSCKACNTNEYVDSINNKCVSCDPNCSQCQTSSTNCTACYNNLTLLNGKCVCINQIYDSISKSCKACNTNEYVDSINNKCVSCDPNCSQCQTSPTNCTTCYNNLTLLNGKCVCVNQIYDSATNSCKSCNTNEYADTVNNKCVSCDPNCSQCQTSSTNCTACYNNLTLQNGKCICVNQIYDSVTNTCKSCSTNEYVDTINNKCVSCDPNCSQCQTSSTNCTTCYNNLTLLNGKCVCVNQIYDSATNSCKSCNTNEYADTVNNKCVSCDPNCSQCQTSSTKCTACYNNLTLQNGKCVCVNQIYDSVSNTCKSCSTNEFADTVNNKCVSCDPNCSQCQTSSTNCTACYNNLTLQNGKCVCVNQIYDSVSNTCKSCSTNEYADTVNNKCVSCDPNCSQCQTSSTNCTVCYNNLTLQNGKCVCVNQIYDSVSNTCKSCSTNEYADTVNNKCVSCNPNCSQCQTSSTNCTTCYNNLTLLNGKCVCVNQIYDSATNSCKSCNTNEYADPLSNKCISCAPNCAQCSQSQTNCTSCFNNLILQNGKCVCQNAAYDSSSNSCVPCLSNQILDQINSKCITCDLKCSTCLQTVSNCTGCLNNLILQNGQCVCINQIYDSATNSCKSCQSNEIFDSTNNKCVSCSSNCKTCKDLNNLNVCTSCSPPLTLNGILCVSQCSSENKCSTPEDPKPSITCHQSCQTCSGTGYDECITCIQNRELNKFYGKSIGTCKCIEGYTDYFLSPCSAQPEVTLIKSMAISSAALNIIVAIMSQNPIVLLFLIDSQQTLSYFRYLNMNKPLNFDKQISPLYYSHLHPFLPNLAKSWLPKTTSSQSSGSGEATSRNLIDDSSTTSNNINSSSNYQLSSGNNRINDNQKYPYFLINAFTIILVQVILWIICWFLGLIEKYKALKPVAQRIINIFRYNCIIVILYLTISELSLLIFYQFTVMSWDTNLEVLSSLFAIIALIYIIGISFILYNITITQREKVQNEEKFYLLFKLFKEKHRINRYYPLVLFMRKVISSMIYALAYPSPQAQAILMIFLYIPFWAYMISKNPFNSLYAKITSVITEFFMLFCHLHLLLLSFSNQNQDKVSITDLLIILIISTLITFAILGGLAIVGYGYIKIKDYRQRRSQIAKIYPYEGVKGTHSSKVAHQKLDNFSNSQKEDSNQDYDQLSALSITQQNVTQTPLKSQQDLSNMNIFNLSSSINNLQTSQDMSMSQNNRLMNSSQNQQLQTRNFDIIDEQSNDDEQSSAKRYGSNYQQKSLSQDNDEQLEFSFRSKLEGIKEQDNEDGSIQFSDAASYGQRKKFIH